MCVRMFAEGARRMLIVGCHWPIVTSIICHIRSPATATMPAAPCRPPTTYRHCPCTSNYGCLTSLPDI